MEVMARPSAAMPRVRPKRAAKKEPHSSDGDSTAQGHPLILAMLDNMGEGVAARLLYDTKAGILLNEHVAEDGAAVSRARVPARRRGHRLKEGRWHLIGPVRVGFGSRSAIARASRCSGSAARIGIGDPGAAPRNAPLRPALE